MFKGKMLLVALAGAFAFSSGAQAGEPLLSVIEIGRDAQLNLKKAADMQNRAKQIQAACAKGKLFSTKKKTLRSHNGKFCDGGWTSAYVLMVCDDGKNDSFYASKCYKKAIVSLDVNAANTAAARAERQEKAKKFVKIWFEKMEKKSLVDVISACQALFETSKKGARHPYIEPLHEIAKTACRFYTPEGIKKPFRK